jgi:hypothetical protein
MSHVVKTFISVTAIILTTLCKLTPAPAQDVFSALQDLAGTLASDPSCTSGGRVAICAVVGVGGHLFVNTYSGTSWSGFQDKGGIVIGKPSCTHFGPSNVQALCGTIGTDGAVWVTVFNGTSWNGFQSIGGVSISNPACTGFAGGAICAVIGANSHLFASTTSDGVTWSAFQDLNLEGTLIFNPTCMDIAWVNSPAALCGAVTTAGELRVKSFRFNNGMMAWDPNPTIITFPTSNMSITSDPSCAAVNTAQIIICGVRGSDSALYVSQSYPNQSGVTTFPQFQFVGGVLAGAPSCASENITSYSMLMPVCAVRGTDSVLYVNQLIPTTICSLAGRSKVCTTVYPYQAIPTTDIKGDPSCTFMLVSVPVQPSGTVSQPQVLCGVKTTDSQLWVTIGK